MHDAEPPGRVISPSKIVRISAARLRQCSADTFQNEMTPTRWRGIVPLDVEIEGRRCSP